ncbi:MAG: KGGVGR-motif variant AAA ATPase [Methylococcales bacterium]
MKTIVFYSVKGEVGRTLALYHMALSLRRRNENVVMLDWDYSAPGLSYKCKLPEERRSGYLEYLMRYDTKARADDREPGKRDRLESLKANAHEIFPEAREERKGRLWLIPAGDDSTQAYWEFLSSFRFHRLFYFGYNEVKGLTPEAFPLKWLELNRHAFKNDKALIEQAFEPDYLLVDCKTSLEESTGIAVLLWADSMAHFLPGNLEGLKYLADTAQAIPGY